MRPTQETPVINQNSRWNTISLRVVDAGILAVVFFAPLFMGGRGPLGKFVFLTIVGLTVVAWAISQTRQAEGHWRRSGVEWLLLAGVLLVTLQLIPLPQSTLARISPTIQEMLPLWSAGDGGTVQLGVWSTISLTPEATRGALVVLMGYIMLFMITIQRIQSMEDVTRILGWIAIGTIAMAALGMVQFLAGNGKFLWIFDHPSRDTFNTVKGSFHNQNHFAHFLALGIGPLIWTWTLAPARSARKQLLAVGLGLVLVAGLLTFSRGGVISIALASMITLTVLFFRSLLDKKAMVVAGVMGVAVMATMLIHGSERLGARFSALQAARSVSDASEGRATLWSAILDGIPNFAWLGSGIGSLREVYPLFMEKHYDVEFTHGESGYLPLALEGGIPALLLLLTGIGICFWWCQRALVLPIPPAFNRSHAGARRSHDGEPSPHRFAAPAGAIMASLTASVVHSLGDFVWYITACMSLTVLLAACACRIYQLANQDRESIGLHGNTLGKARTYQVAFAQPAWIGITLILVIVTTMMIHDRHHSAFAAPYWYGYKRIALKTYATNVPADEVERDMLFEMATQLELGLRQNPHDPRMNLRYAAACLRRFDLEQRHAVNPMALQQIREAALASQFRSKKEQDDWLELAVGENMKLLHLALFHCRRALRASPLQGDGYVYLADLSFLEGPNPAAKSEYIAQALRVRPHSGMVAFAQGQESALAGDMDAALNSWRTAFQQDPQIRRLIVEQFSPSVPAAFFLEHFEPEIASLRQLKQTYFRLGQTADAHVAAQQLAVKLAQKAGENHTDAAKTWFELHDVHNFLEDLPAALKCAQRAADLDQNNISYRRTLGELLLKNQEFAAAAREIQWCLRRQPDDKQLEQQLTAAKRGDLQLRSAKSPTVNEPF